jgi:hypothetical protein
MPNARFSTIDDLRPGAVVALPLGVGLGCLDAATKAGCARVSLTVQFHKIEARKTYLLMVAQLG